jgi:hypothetical protein
MVFTPQYLIHITWHFHHNAAITTKRPVEFNITLPLFESVDSIADGEAYKIIIGPVYLTATSLGF